MSKPTNQTIKVEVITGVEGRCLAINGHRVAGPKPWGGGTVVNEWDVPKSRLLDALAAFLEAERAAALEADHG